MGTGVQAVLGGGYQNRKGPMEDSIGFWGLDSERGTRRDRGTARNLYGAPQKTGSESARGRLRNEWQAGAGWGRKNESGREAVRR